MKTPLGVGVLTAIQNRVNSSIDNFVDPSNRATLGRLRQLLESNVDMPDMRLFDMSPLSDDLDLDGLIDGIRTRLRSRLQGLLKRDPTTSDLADLDLTHVDLDDLKLGNLRSLVQRLVDGDPIAVIRERIGSLAGGAGGGGADQDKVADEVRSIVGRQVGVGLSFISTLRNLADPQLPAKVLAGWQSYFFGEGGFATVDGLQIVAPGHTGLVKALTGETATPSGAEALARLNVQELQQGWRGLRGLLGERSAEQYVRDLIRIVVEVGGDQRYGLRDRLPALLKSLSQSAQREKAERWFKGAGSMAESLLTSTVEQAALGVAQFQTNPILAAAAATYAGTAARKASQHTFLLDAGV